MWSQHWWNELICNRPGEVRLHKVRSVYSMWSRMNSLLNWTSCVDVWRTLQSALHFIRPSYRKIARLLQADKEQKVADELPKVRQFHPKQLILVQKNDNKTWSKGVVMHDMVTPMCTTLSVKEERCENMWITWRPKRNPLLTKVNISRITDLFFCQVLIVVTCNRALVKPTVVQGTEFSKPNVVQGTNKPKVVDQGTVSSKEGTDKNH